MIERTAHALTTLIQHMGVDHRRAHIPMTEELLNRANVVAGFQQMRGERVPSAWQVAGLQIPAALTASFTAR
jgi:hypothetical protein